jgi:hypothetical protein
MAGRVGRSRRDPENENKERQQEKASRHRT